jgi:hypothetical protein
MSFSAVPLDLSLEVDVLLSSFLRNLGYAFGMTWEIRRPRLEVLEDAGGCS